MIAVASLLLVTLTGLDRFIPLFRLATEPQVQLKKNMSANDLQAWEAEQRRKAEEEAEAELEA